MNPLLKILQQIDKPGSFCSSNRITPCFLGLEVNNIGTIALPLSATQAKELITQCQQAPFGRGEKTLVDTQVRNVWELEPEQFVITNPQWQQRLNDICSEVADELGVIGATVCELYKLLVYQQGSFFLPHRDTEKLARMFATLVIVLPSQHEGGELIIRHDGVEKCFAFGGEDSGYDMRYAAFYADCQHEVKPVTSGYRLCLIYNLALAKQGKTPPLAPKNSTVVTTLTDYLRDWVAQEPVELADEDAEEQENSKKLVVLLEHRYTEAELDFRALKNLDRVKAQVLVEAAQAADCRAHLALVTLWQMGDIDGYGYDNDYYDESDCEMGEVLDSSLSVDHWLDRDGNHKDFGEMQLREQDIVAKDDIDEGTPDEEDVEGPTGNAGATMERWYHRAAVVIWANKDHFTVLTHAGQCFAIPQLAEMVEENPVDTAAGREFALAIMDNWLWHNDRFSIDDTETTASTQLFLFVLLRLGDDSLVVEFFDAILTGDFFGTEGLAIRTACQHIGWARFADGLLLMSKQTHANRVRAFSQILAVLSEGAAANKQQQELCLTLTRNALDSLLRYGEETVTFSNKAGIEQAKQPTIVCLFKACYLLNQASLLEELGRILTASKDRFPLRTVVIPVIRELHQWLATQTTPSPVFNSAFLQPCLVQIKQAATLIIKEPKDWAQQVKLSCQCADCMELGQFLHNPIQQEYRFRMRQDRRDHVEREIKSQDLDISCSTERIGSPHTLVCLKNRASYFRAKEQQAIDNELWWELQQF